MLSDTTPTAAELRVMRAEAAQVRAELQEQNVTAPVIELPQQVKRMAVAS